jgi:hypothetical protein
VHGDIFAAINLIAAAYVHGVLSLFFPSLHELEQNPYKLRLGLGRFNSMFK